MSIMKSLIWICFVGLSLCYDCSNTALMGMPQDRRQTFDLSSGAKVNMILVKPGVFTMGSPEDEVGRIPEREKQQRIDISKGFWLAETEVTQVQWESVMGFNPSKNIGKDLPVDQVSYLDIQDFLKKVNVGEQKFRLPTEAEWEYACRAGTSGPYAGERDEMAWHSGNSDRKSHPVRQKKPNPWGFYDMHGNLLEWCSDPFAEGLIVQRGGQFTGRLRHTRAADRQRSAPDKRMFFVGFRLARDK